MLQKLKFNFLGKGMKKADQSVKQGFAYMTLGLGLAFALSSCEKNSATGDFNKAGSAGALQATLSCADTVSIPVDANGIITIPKLTSDKLWKLNGISYVKDGQTLTIDPGTTIITGSKKKYQDWSFGTREIAGLLVIAKGAKLIANGSESQPIVFTSPSSGGCGSGCSNAGAFGGIVILGKATANPTIATQVEGIPQIGAAVDLTFGGPRNRIDGDNSGSLNYVRIEFPGYKLATDNEINGLTLAGVGTGTTLSHIQVSYSATDAFKFFGGKVNADHLVAIGTDDDDFDFDLGYVGTIDYAIGLKDPSSTNSTSGGNSDSNGIESDNNGGGTAPAPGTPYTKPTLRHFTLLGYQNNTTGVGKLRSGNRWRRATSLDMQYSIIGGFPTATSFENITNPSNFSNNVIQAYTAGLVNSPTAPSVNTPNNILSPIPSTAPANNYLLLGPTSVSPFFSCATAATYNPGYLIPRSGSPAYGTASTFKGAFQPGVAPWTTNWTNFSPGFCCN